MPHLRARREAERGQLEVLPFAPALDALLRHGHTPQVALVQFLEGPAVTIPWTPERTAAWKAYGEAVDAMERTTDPRARRSWERLAQTRLEAFNAATERAKRTPAEPTASDFAVERNFKCAGTSSDAAERAAKAARLGDTHRRVFDFLRDHGPHTCDEIAAILGMARNTARARVSDLKNAGWAEATGDTRATGEGSGPCDVVRAVERRAVA